MKRWRRVWHYWHLRLLRLRSTPELISRGFAFGVFWGMFPLPGLQMAIAILTAVIFGGNKLAAAAGTWLSNPVTTLPFTALNFHLGQWALGRELSDLPPNAFSSLNSFFELGQEVITSYLMGCLISGAIAGSISYIIGIPLITGILHRAHQARSRRGWRLRHRPPHAHPTSPPTADHDDHETDQGQTKRQASNHH